SLAHGARAIMLQEPDAREILRLIPLKGVTQSMAVPAVILAIIQLPEAQAADFSSLRSWTYGGSPIPEDVLSQATKILGCDFVQ
ncbi:AMP-binding protein, partial [Acinetobacter baumannii]